MLSVAICDDEKIVTSEIEQRVLACCQNKLIKCEPDIFFNGDKLLTHIKNGVYYDIVYIDIEMETINGIETAKIIKQISPETMIIYITAFENYMLETFDTEPFRFITKPVDEEKFVEIFNAACEKRTSQNAFFDFSFKKEHKKVPIREIMYFESKRRMIYIVTSKGKGKFYGKLDDIEQYLKKNRVRFLRIHQSYLVNYNYICKLGFDKIVLSGGVQLQVSKDRQKKMREQYLKYLR